jgi:hypothetical protein
MLTLATQPAQSAPVRSLIPPCLQQRAPHNYELFDEAGNRLQPTLSGYKLTPGHSYSLKVRSQDGKIGDWKLRLLAPRSQVDAAANDYVEDDQRCIQFHVESRPIWEQLKSRISMLPVHLEHADGSPLYRFEIPVVLTMHWSMWLVSWLGIICAPLGFLFEGSTLSTKTQCLVAAVCLAFIGLSVADLWRAYQRGRQVLQKNGDRESTS